jgi:hypothetical protein
MSKLQLEEVQQSINFTKICVGSYDLFTTTRRGEDVILAEANELRAFWEALFPNLTKDLHDKNKWGLFKAKCKETSCFHYVRDLDERYLQKVKGFDQVLSLAGFYPVMDIVVE